MILVRAPYPREWLALCPVIGEIGILMAFPRERGACMWFRLCAVAWHKEGQDLAWPALWWRLSPVHPNLYPVLSCCPPFVSLLHKIERMFVAKVDVFPHTQIQGNQMKELGQKKRVLNYFGIN